MIKECCGTCKYHKNVGNYWECTCEKSDEYSDYTDYDFICEEWEEKNESSDD